MTRAKYYVGVKKSNRKCCDIFASATVPTEKTHGARYNFCFGGYRTKREAVQVAMYQNYIIDNPAYNERCKHDYR